MDMDEEDFVFFGTPIEREEELTSRKKKAIAEASGHLRTLPSWKQEVVLLFPMCLFLENVKEIADLSKGGERKYRTAYNCIWWSLSILYVSFCSSLGLYSLIFVICKKFKLSEPRYNVWLLTYVIYKLKLTLSALLLPSLFKEDRNISVKSEFKYRPRSPGSCSI